MDKPKIENMLRLIRLMSRKERFSIDELSMKMETSPRTVYRYIDTLKDCGFVVEKVSGNVYHLVKVPAQYQDLSHLMCFSEEELFIINRAIDSIDDTNTIKLDLKKKLATVYDCINMPEIVTTGKMTTIVSSLAEAIKSKKQVTLCDYMSSHGKNKRNRHVEPFRFTVNFQQIWAFDLEDGCNKLFKCSRIGSITIGEDWQNEISHQEGYVDAFRFAGFERMPIKMRLGITAYNLLIEEYPLAEKFITKDSKGKWIFETELCSYVGACRFYMGLADDIEILESPKFQEYINQYIESFFK